MLLLLVEVDILEVDSWLVMKCCYREWRCVFPFRFRQRSVQEKAPARDIILSFYTFSLFFLSIRSLLARSVGCDFFFLSSLQERVVIINCASCNVRYWPIKCSACWRRYWLYSRREQERETDPQPLETNLKSVLMIWTNGGGYL